MLKIILGAENLEKYVDMSDKRYVRFASTWFNNVKEQSWFSDPFVQRIIREIDEAEVELGYAVKSIVTGDGYSVNDLSSGAKFLILAYAYLNNDGYILRMRMGENCVSLFEQIVKMYDAKGKDLIIVAEYFHHWNYDVLSSVYYYNWDVTVHNEKEAYELAFRPWFDYNEPVREEQTEEEEDAELEMIGKDIERRLKLREANSQSLKEQSLDKLVY